MDMEIFLTEHMTEHTLDGTICKIYLEPQDEVETTAQDSNSTTCKIHEAPKDEVLTAQLSTLADVIKKRDWDLLSIELKLRAHEELRVREGKGLLLLLHLALRFDAPLSIISQLTHGIHNSASHRDAEGRLPLHVAISKVSQLSVISHVLMLNPRACTSVDNQGSTPLHICFDENVMHAFKASQFRELVRTLVESSPESLAIEDRSSRCPIERAILSDAPLKVVLLMQLSKRNYMRQKYHPSGKSYATCTEKMIMLKDMSSRHVTGRIGVNMFG
jgi:hypothetical protein